MDLNEISGDMEGAEQEVGLLRANLNNLVEGLTEGQVEEETGAMETSGYDNTGAPIRRPVRRVKPVIRHSKSDLRNAIAPLDQRLQALESKLRANKGKIKLAKNTVLLEKNAAMGNRAEFTLSVTVAAAGSGTATLTKSNSPVLYGQFYVSCTTGAGTLTSITSDGNPLLDGDGSLAVASTVEDRIRELAVPVSASGNGVTFTAANPGAASVTFTLHLVPVGHKII